jgi:amidase
MFNSPWSYTGLPSICIPTGRSADGLPLALQLVGRHGKDAELLAGTAWCEAALCVDVGDPLC